MCTTKRDGLRWEHAIWLLAGALCWGQSAEPASPSAMVVRLTPGESSRYEFEGIVHIASDHPQNVSLNVPEDCSYHLRAVLKFDFDPSSATGALGGRVLFQGVRYDGPVCATSEHAALVKALQKLESDGMRFDVNPAGDARIAETPSANEGEGVNLLAKAVWDLLQVHLSDHAVSPASTWFPSRRFLYWPDTFVEDMEVAAASMQ